MWYNIRAILSRSAAKAVRGPGGREAAQGSVRMARRYGTAEGQGDHSLPLIQLRLLNRHGHRVAGPFPNPLLDVLPHADDMADGAVAVFHAHVD